MYLIFLFYLFLLLNGFVKCRTYLVSNSVQLREYLRSVGPGDTIQLRDGFYSGVFTANRFGTPEAPIRIVGSKRAVLTNNRGTALYLTGQFWWLNGFTISNSKKGISVQGGRNNLIERLTINNIGEEGIALRQDSVDNTIRNCIIIRTGLQVPQYGFGIAIGSDETQSYRGFIDRSNRNSIVGNRLQTGSIAEAIRVYEGTCCGIIRDNNFDGRPVTNVNGVLLYNRCWVSVNGNNYRIENNIGRNTANDGFRVRMTQVLNRVESTNNRQTGNNRQNSVSGDSSTQQNRDYDSNDDNFEIQGCGNQFKRNRCEMNSNGYCIHVFNPNLCRISVYSDNTKSGNGVLSNVPIMNLQ